MMPNQDYQILESITEDDVKQMTLNRYNELLSSNGEVSFEYPFDILVIDDLVSLRGSIREDDDDFIIFSHITDIKKIWRLALEKSIKCLRFFDKREPFYTNTSKKPIAYGIDDLVDYFDKYTDFESMLYGSNKYYRDHVIHAFRTWILGLDCLLKNDATYLDKINIGKGINVNSFEKLSIWTLIALTHDLGYPLEKAQNIINKTKEMMRSFVANPNVSMDLAFSGVQDNINDFVVRFLSSKMHERSATEKNLECQDIQGDEVYVARLQPKYYMKFSKSLEKSMHGIISAIIIYKLLLYFLESDYSLNEDYYFSREEVRQFYIRREILRAIASHTCPDIYHLDMMNYSFLLIIADDVQEWGRKRLSEFFTSSNKKYELVSIKSYFLENANIMEISEKYVLTQSLTQLEYMLTSLFKQSKSYIAIFRDGQDTANRNFDFIKKCELDYHVKSNKAKFIVHFNVSRNVNTLFQITYNKTNNNKTDKLFSEKWMEKMFIYKENSRDKTEEEQIMYTIIDLAKN